MNKKSCKELSVCHISKKQTGNYGELKAKDYFQKNDYQIVATNFRAATGEIDIIASKLQNIVFVEVKTLPSGNIELLQKVLNSNKQKRIIETAKYFLSTTRKYNDSFVRFDVVVIDMPGYPDVYHIENAFAEFS